MKKLLALLLIMTVGMTYTWNCFDVDESLNCNSTSWTLNYSEAGNQTVNILYPDADNKSYYVTNVTFTFTGNPVANWTHAYVGGDNLKDYEKVQLLNSTTGFVISTRSEGGVPYTFYLLDAVNSSLTEISNVSGEAFDILSDNFGFVGSNEGKIYFFDGSSLILNQSLSVSTIKSIDLYSSSLGFAGGHKGGTPYISMFNGSEWVNETLPDIGGEIRVINILNESLAFAAGNFFKIIEWNGSDWSNNSFSFPYSCDVNYIDNYGDDLAFAVGTTGFIAKWNGSEWINETNNPVYNTNYNLKSVVVSYTNRAYIVGTNPSGDPLFMQWNGSHWEITDEVAAGTNGLYSVSDVKGSVNTNVAYAVGDNDEIYRRWGYPNKMSISDISPGWFQSGTELRTEIWDNDEWDGHWEWYGSTYPDSYYDYFNISSDGPASVTVEWEFTYGTKLVSDIHWLAFKLENGTLVNETAITEDSDVFVWNVSTLVAKIPMNFSSAPNYTGWNAEAGVITADNRTYVSTANLTDADNPMNTSLKTLYLKRGNNSLSAVCFTNASVTGHDLDDIFNETDCTTQIFEGWPGGAVLYPEVVNISGVDYFEIPDVEGSGAVQILMESENNPPAIQVLSAPTSSDQFTPVTFSVSVIDADPEDIVTVSLEGVSCVMTEVESGLWSCTTTLSLSESPYSYRFSASDGTNTTYTGYYSLVISQASSAGVVTSAPGFGLELAVLLFAVTALVMVFRE